MSAFYNDNDRKACAWLSELAANGHISSGVVSDKSIKELDGDYLRGYERVHLFAGIGGWDYALRLAGWPDDVPVWTGSCPCQPFSAAGKGRGTDDERHLWPEMLRLIRECQPPVVFGEQVASKAGREWLARVRADLEALGYAVGASDLCAAGVGAPHIRQRLFWVADADEAGRAGQRSETGDDRRAASTGGGEDGRLADLRRSGLEGRPRTAECADQLAPGEGGVAGGVGNAELHGSSTTREPGEPQEEGRVCESQGSGFWSRFDLIPCRDGKARRVEPGTFPLAHGVPARVGRLRGYGNAIVPQLAAVFIRSAMESFDDLHRMREEPARVRVLE